MTRISRILKEEEISKSIMGLGMEVLNALCPRLDEKLHEIGIILNFKINMETSGERKKIRDIRVIRG